MEAFEKLEQEFGTWAGFENVVACSSGTASLHLAVETLQLPPGSEVICPDFNMIAVPRACTLAGMVPVFVDCNDDLLLNLDLVDEACSTDPYLSHNRHGIRALIVVHIYGRSLDMGAVHALAAKYNLPVIEDLAEAHGVRPHPDSFAACWSFYANKIVAGSEGGAIAFRYPGSAALARQLRCLGFTPDHDFMHISRGINARMSNAHASLILDSLARVDRNLLLRRQIEGWYNNYCPAEWRMPPRAVPWVYDLRVPGMHSTTQTRVVKELNRVKVGARHAFKPMSWQPEYRNCRLVSNGKATRLSQQVIYLPVQPGITTEDDVRRAFDTIKQILERDQDLSKSFAS